MKKWKTSLAILILLLAIILNHQGFWALLILLSIIHMLYEREIYFFELIKMKENPWQFWILFALLMFFEVHEMLSYLGLLEYLIAYY